MASQLRICSTTIAKDSQAHRVLVSARSSSFLVVASFKSNPPQATSHKQIKGQSISLPPSTGRAAGATEVRRHGDDARPCTAVQSGDAAFTPGTGPEPAGAAGQDSPVWHLTPASGLKPQLQPQGPSSSLALSVVHGSVCLCAPMCLALHATTTTARRRAVNMKRAARALQRSPVCFVSPFGLPIQCSFLSKWPPDGTARSDAGLHTPAHRFPEEDTATPVSIQCIYAHQSW